MMTQKALNDCPLKPVQFKIVVKVDEVEQKTAGGIYIPDTSKDAQQFSITRGTIVAVGPAAFTDHDQYPEGSEIPEVGSRIYFQKFAGASLNGAIDNTIVYRVIEDTDIVGIIADEHGARGLAA